MVASNLDSDTASSSPRRLTEKERKKAALDQLLYKRGSLKRKYRDDTPRGADVHAAAVDRMSLPLTPPESPSKSLTTNSKHEMNSNRVPGPTRCSAVSQISTPKTSVVFEHLDDSDNDDAIDELHPPPPLPIPKPTWQPKQRPNFAKKGTTLLPNTRIALPRLSTSPQMELTSTATSRANFPVMSGSFARGPSIERRGISPVDSSFDFLTHALLGDVETAAARPYEMGYADNIELPPSMAPSLQTQCPPVLRISEQSTPSRTRSSEESWSKTPFSTQFHNPSQTPPLCGSNVIADTESCAPILAAKPQHPQFSFARDDENARPNSTSNGMSTMGGPKALSRSCIASPNTSDASRNMTRMSAMSSSSKSSQPTAAQSTQCAPLFSSDGVQNFRCSHCDIPVCCFRAVSRLQFTAEAFKTHVATVSAVYSQMPARGFDTEGVNDDDTYVFDDLEAEAAATTRAPLRPVRPPSPSKPFKTYYKKAHVPDNTEPSAERPPALQLADQLFPEAANDNQTRFSAIQKAKARAIDADVNAVAQRSQPCPPGWLIEEVIPEEIVPHAKNRAVNSVATHQTIQPAVAHNTMGLRKLASTSTSANIIDIDDYDNDDDEFETDAVAARLGNPSIFAKPLAPRARPVQSKVSGSPLKGSSYLSKLPTEVQDLYWNLVGGRPNQPMQGRSHQLDNSTTRKPAAQIEDCDDDETADAQIIQKRRLAPPTSKSGPSVSSRSGSRAHAASSSRIRPAPMRGGSWFARGKRRKRAHLG